MKKQILQILLILLVFAAPALATDYTANFQTQIKTNGVWSSPISNSLNVSQTPVSVPGGITFTLYQITATTAWFKLSASPALPNGMVDLYVSVNDVQCFRDSGNRCNTADAINSSDGAIKFTLSSITQQSTATITTGSINTSSPIYAYLYDTDNKEVALKANGAKVVDFTPAAGEDAVKDVTVYFRNSQKVPATISVIGGTREPRYNWYSDRIEYVIDEAGTFNFSVKYNQLNPWGYLTEQVDNYKLTLKGLANKNTVAAIGTYRLLQSEDIQITMTQPGTFTPIDGATPSANGDNKYTFKFAYPGNYHIKYTTSGGSETYVDFDVRPAPTPVPTSLSNAPGGVAPTVNIAGNQVQGDSGNIYYVAIGFVLLIVIGIFMMKRKKEPANRFQPNKVT